MEEQYDPATGSVDASRVTVIVPCYNAAQYLPATLASIDDQTVQGFEIVLFDDGSADATYEVIATWAAATPGARAVRRDENRGVCRTLNEALQLVTTEFTIIFGADDVMLPHLVEDALRTIDRLAVHYAAVALIAIVGDADGVAEIDADGELRTFDSPKDVESAQPGELLPWLLVANRFASSALFRTEAVRRPGFDEALDIEDWDMWCQIASAYRIGTVSRPTYIYRNTPGSLDKRLKSSGRWYVNAAMLRAKWTRKSPEIDAAIAARTRTDLHILLAAERRAEAADVLRLLSDAGLSHRFHSERFMLRAPTWLLRPVLVVPQRIRRAFGR